MGAYESQLATSLFFYLNNEKDVGIYPNPITNQSVISLQLNSPGEVCFSIFDINGKLVWEDPKSTYHKGLNQIPLNHIKLKAGYYLIKILFSNDTNRAIKKKILVL